MQQSRLSPQLSRPLVRVRRRRVLPVSSARHDSRRLLLRLAAAAALSLALRTDAAVLPQAPPVPEPVALSAVDSDFGGDLAESALALLSRAAELAGTDVSAVLSQLALTAAGALLGGAAAYQLATSAAAARADQAALVASRAALNSLSPEDLTRVLGELPKWLVYRDFERAAWVNRILTKAWPYLDAATSGLVLGALGPILEATRPAFLTSLRFERFSFGAIPARIEGIKVYETEGEDAVEVDLDVVWTGDPDVILGVRAAADAVRVPVSVTALQVSGTLRLTFGPLLPKFPCFGAVSVALMGKPTLAFDLRVVGSDITLVPGVSTALRAYLKSLLTAYLVWPRRVTFAIPGTGYALPAPGGGAAKGTLYVRLLGAEAVAEDDEEPSLGSRMRLGAETRAALRWTQPAAPEASADATSAASLALRVSAPAALRPGASMTLPVEDPSAQALWLGLFDATREGASRGRAMVGEAAIPLALLIAREGQTVELVAELAPSLGLEQGGLGVAQPSGLGALWSGIAGGVAGATAVTLRAAGGAWAGASAEVAAHGWGGLLSLPRGAWAAGAAAAAASPPPPSPDVPPPGLPPGAQRIAGTWLVEPSAKQPVALRILAPGSACGALRLEVRYEQGALVQPLAAEAEPMAGAEGAVAAPTARASPRRLARFGARLRAAWAALEAPQEDA